MKDFIKQRNLEKKNILLFKKIPFNILHPYPAHINIETITQTLEKKIPASYFLKSHLETIYVGKFKELQSRNIQAMYEDGTIYLSNHENNEKISELQISKDITHELAHAISEVVGLDIYSDLNIENEFLSKRRTLESILEIEDYNTSLYDFENAEYNKNFDFFLYNEVGYDKLSIFTIGLFDSPYSATSIHEYFANGFEDYFFEDIAYMKKISPKLFEKIESLEIYIRGLR